MKVANNPARRARRGQAAPQLSGRVQGILAIALVASLCTSNETSAQPSAADPSSDDLPDPLRLEQAIQLARGRRAEITAARARVRGAAQRPAVVSALEDPMVSVSLDHLPFMLHGADVSLSIEQRFPLSGIRGNRRSAAQADSQRVGAEAERVAIDVDLDAANAFLMLQERRAIALILAEQGALAQQFISAANARYSSGTGAQADVLRAEIEVARVQGARRSIGAEVRAAEAMLNTALGRPAVAKIPALDGSVSIVAPAAAEAIRDAALDRRPELRAGLAEIARARADVSVMESMYWPMAMVRTGPAYTMTDGAGWMVMVGVSVPIWRGRLQAGVAEAEAMVEMAEADLEAMRRMVEGDAVVSREQVVAARERMLALRDDILPRARQAIDPTLAGYAAGQVPLVSVIEAAQTLWSSQAELAAAELELGLAWARLHRATGDRGS